jgi:hypothetical protein
VTVAALTGTPPSWWIEEDDALVATFLDVWIELHKPKTGG